MSKCLVRPTTATPIQPQKLLYSPNDAASLLGISRAMLYRLMESELASIKVGRCRRIHRDELERIAREGVSE